MIPHWATDANIGRQTYNARSETVASKPSFRDAWRKGQHCTIPADAIFEPDWRSGKAVPARIVRADVQRPDLTITAKPTRPVKNITNVPGSEIGELMSDGEDTDQTA